MTHFGLLRLKIPASAQRSGLQQESRTRTIMPRLHTQAFTCVIRLGVVNGMTWSHTHIFDRQWQGNLKKKNFYSEPKESRLPR